MMTEPFQPQDVTDLQLAFPASVFDLMPDQADIPDEYKSGVLTGWVGVQSRWFFSGLTGAQFEPKTGIDEMKALRHLGAIQGSFEPKHEHKSSAVAYLLSLWFDDVKIDGKSLVQS